MAIYIVIAVFVLIVGGIGAFYLARFMKGKLTIELTHNSANSEERITGRVTLEAKRPIHGQLNVSLVGHVERTKRDSENMKTTEWIEVYRDDHTLEETRDFIAGFQQDYDFDLRAPTQTEVRTGTGAASVAGGRVHWHVESRLDAEGVDLYDKEKCHVNLQG